jgi:hypothetical protein
MSARVTIDRVTPDQAWITVREGVGGIATFVLFVTGIAVVLYWLIPAARTSPGPLLVLVTIALAWAGVALSAKEECIVDRGTRTVAARYTWLFGHREDRLTAGEIGAVRLGIGGPDDDRRLVELLGTSGKVRLRLPRRVNTFTATDQKTVGRLLAEYLSVPVQG